MNTISENVSPWRPSVEVAVVANPEQRALNPEAKEAGEDDGFKMFGDDGFTFLDFLDIINPLQHIPVIGTLYRQMTDDTLDPASRVIGGTLFFGPVGTVASLANVLVDDATGKDLGEHALAFFDDEYKDAPETTARNGEAVADVGRRGSSFSPLETSPVPATPGAVDPITAWAMSEIANRKSGPGNLSALGGNLTPEERGALVLEKAGLIPEERGALVEDVATLIPEERGALVEEFAALPTPPTAPWKVAEATGQKAEHKFNKVLEWASAASALRQTKQSGALFAANTYANTQTADSEKKTARTSTRTPAPTPPGALAPEGGWFSDTMLGALGKYKDGADLNDKNRTAAIDLRR